MPNWNLNCVTIKHDDKAMMDRLAKAAEDGNLFNEFFPTPDKLKNTPSPATDEIAEANVKEFGAADWYNWNLDNWGTKWDISLSDMDRLNDNEVFLCFDTAWSAPIAFYEKMAELGFEIDALFLETGMCVVGAWTSEGHYECHEYDFSDPDFDADMSEDVKDFLQCEYENWLEFNEEKDEETVH